MEIQQIAPNKSLIYNDLCNYHPTQSIASRMNSIRASKRKTSVPRRSPPEGRRKFSPRRTTSNAGEGLIDRSEPEQGQEKTASTEPGATSGSQAAARFRPRRSLLVTLGRE